MTLLDRAIRIGGAGAARRLGIVFAVYVLHAVFALALAWPIARIVADPVLAHPRGDRVLFEPGGLYLSEAIRLARVPLTGATEGMTFGVLAGLYLGLLPLAALVYSVARDDRPSLAELMTAAGRSFGALSLLLGFALVLGALASAVPITVGNLLETKIKVAFGDRGSDFGEAAFLALACAVACVVGVVHDLARTAVVTREMPALRAAALAVEMLRAHPVEALGGWALRGLSAILLVTVAARTATHIGVETTSRLAAVTLLHQAVAFALVFLRADWLTLATRLAAADYRRDR